jgi:dihydroorotase
MKQKTILIKNAWTVNDGLGRCCSVAIENGKISQIFRGEFRGISDGYDEVIDAKGLILLPGAIDTHVHFREPGLTHKGDIASESRAAVAGGITSFIDMPNVVPQTTTVDALNEKFERAKRSSLTNYSFYLGATNDNLEELVKEGAKRAAGIKVFMGSSTGNMLVDNSNTLAKIFQLGRLTAVHCEDENIIRQNSEQYKGIFGDNIPFSYHPSIRSAKACYTSAQRAVKLALNYGTRLHLLHISTAKELSLLDKNISGEICVNYLWFTDKDYEMLGSRIKCNPAIKTLKDREKLRGAIRNMGNIIVSTDHAPHTKEEKVGNYWNVPSGIPSIQHSLVMMLELYWQGILHYETVVEKMCHNPATLFGIKNRGFIREGYYADLVLVALNPKSPWTVSKDNILYKCGWSPLENQSFSHKVVKTFVNGQLVYNDGNFLEDFRGMELEFNNK